jgi:predicted nuclease of predicted toxin-antitoxin system
MLSLLMDQNFDQDILQGLYRRIPNLDAVTAFDMGLSRVPDPELLAWAAENNRILVTHDHQTMPDHVANRIAAGGRVAGVIIVPQQLHIRRAIDDLEIIIMCSIESDWINPIHRLPL